MKIKLSELRKIIKEENAKLVNETANAQRYYEEMTRDFAFNISQIFKQDMFQLFDGLEPEVFQGNQTREEWSQQLNAASDVLREEIEQTVKKNIDKIETDLRGGEFQS